MALSRLSLALTVGTLVVLAAPVHAQSPAAGPRSIIFGGDREFPPYEYLDDAGEPQGFNI